MRRFIALIALVVLALVLMTGCHKSHGHVSYGYHGGSSCQPRHHYRQSRGHHHHSYGYSHRRGCRY